MDHELVGGRLIHYPRLQDNRKKSGKTLTRDVSINSVGCDKLKDTII